MLNAVEPDNKPTVSPQADLNDMPTSLEEYLGLKMYYKELRAEWKSLEMFPNQLSEEDRESKRPR